jgi:molecular chaperone DnaK (HSP70)
MNNDMKNGEHNDLCVGIDLGTTNSVLATINVKPNGDIVSKVVDIPRPVDIYNTVSAETKLSTEKRPTLPSCVYYREEKNYEPLVGDFAKVQYPLRPHLVAKSIKSQMGRPEAEGLSPDVPDKSPAMISSRILRHMLKSASNIYRCELTDAVITVPANFDSAMCKATRDAAELAGIKVKNADGSERPVLLSEPNAVIYDLINQIHNGEISSHILDLSEKKNVMVFDLGGGTLDITMHEIKRREGLGDALKVDEIATNRYTLLGGNDFDEEIAAEMYERYLKQYRSYPNAVTKLKVEKKVIMPLLRVYAEHLKLDLNERCGEDYSSGWDDDDEEISLNTGGSMGGIGYSYDDTFTKEEIEAILGKFMAEELVFDDYKRLDRITSTRNIIYPILDVLKKASEKTGREDVRVDAVVVNGGMSKFYMVTDRLKSFFGFDPIVALDPDQAVARGAAVYHYYLHKYEEMQDDMRMLGELEASSVDSRRIPQSGAKSPSAPMAIEWGRSILNDSLYLGVKNGGVHQIIPTGAELPYRSEVMTGFRVEPGQNMIAIPIKSRNIDGTYRTIANGNISFKHKYPDGAFVAFMIYMGSSKVITMKAWTSSDGEGNEKEEEGHVEIAIDNSERPNAKTRVVAPSGSMLRPREEINNLLQLCQNYSKPRADRGTISKRIAACVNNICNAGNKGDFAEAVLDALYSVSNDETRERLFCVARKTGVMWKDAERRKLAQICMNQLSAEFHGMSIGGRRVSANIQAIYALSMCGDRDQMEKLSALHSNSRYLQACLYAHAKTRTQVPWLKEEFDRDVAHARRRMSTNLQFSSHAMGIALRKEKDHVQNVKLEEDTVRQLCGVIKTGQLTSAQLICCILALGWICDQRQEPNGINGTLLEDALDAVRSIDFFYDELVTKHCVKARDVAVKLINGELLNAAEEQFLLTKLDI